MLPLWLPCSSRRSSWRGCPTVSTQLTVVNADGDERLCAAGRAGAPLPAGFWLKEKVVYDQPQVLDNGEFIVVAQGFRGTGEPFQILATSSQSVNALLGPSFRSPVFQV